MVSETPVVTVDEVFAVNSKIRWVGLTTAGGEVVLNQMRPGVQSHSPTQADEEFVKLGPLTLLGVAERYSEYLKGVDSVVVWFGLAVCVYARLGSQVISVSIEKDTEALSQFLNWLNKVSGVCVASCARFDGIDR
jgi:hypothetical protein